MFFSFPERVSCVIIAGGYNKSSVEVLTDDLGTRQLPNLPDEIWRSSMILHNGTILLCGGHNNRQMCLQLDHGTWKEHSTLNRSRVYHSAVTTQTATFLFGGDCSRKTYEYLPKDSTTWLMGKTNIPGGFGRGCAIAVKSDQEIWLIGGRNTERRILSFNVNDHTFEVLPSQLNFGRIRPRCAFIPNTKKLMITGGRNMEVLDTEDGSVTMANPMNSMWPSYGMNSNRSSHGIGVLTIKGEDRIAVFGGFDGRAYLDSIETYNSQTEKWEKSSDIKLSKTKYDFGYLSVKLSNILSKLQ